MKIYYITNPAAFLALSLPVPSAAMVVFWSQGTAGGVLLLPGVHYTTNGRTWQLMGVNLSAGDRIAVIG